MRIQSSDLMRKSFICYEILLLIKTYSNVILDNLALYSKYFFPYLALFCVLKFLKKKILTGVNLMGYIQAPPNKIALDRQTELGSVPIRQWHRTFGPKDITGL